MTAPELDLPDGNSTSRIYLASNLSQSLMVGSQDLASVVAHELGHAAQFAVSSNSTGQRFFDESMAAWLAEEVVPGSALDLVDAGQFATPDLPLDYNVGTDKLGFDTQVYGPMDLLRPSGRPVRHRGHQADARRRADRRACGR